MLLLQVLIPSSSADDDDAGIPPVCSSLLPVLRLRPPLSHPHLSWSMAGDSHAISGITRQLMRRITREMWSTCLLAPPPPLPLRAMPAFVMVWPVKQLYEKLKLCRKPQECLKQYSTQWGERGRYCKYKTAFVFKAMLNYGWVFPLKLWDLLSEKYLIMHTLKVFSL